jgi:hypothetical protein
VCALTVVPRVWISPNNEACRSTLFALPLGGLLSMRIALLGSGQLGFQRGHLRWHGAHRMGDGFEHGLLFRARQLQSFNDGGVLFQLRSNAHLQMRQLANCLPHSRHGSFLAFHPCGQPRFHLWQLGDHFPHARATALCCCSMRNVAAIRPAANQRSPAGRHSPRRHSVPTVKSDAIPTKEARQRGVAIPRSPRHTLRPAATPDATP